MKQYTVPLLLLCLLQFTCQTTHANVTVKSDSHVAATTETEMQNEYATNKTPTHDLPAPMQQSNAQDNDDDKNVYSIRNARSRRPTLMELALQESVREGLNAMTQLYSKIQPDMIRNGQLLQDDHPAALLSRFNAPNEDTTQREMAAYATLSATKAFRKNYKHINELARQTHAQKISLRRTALEGLCPPRDPPTCMPASERYRTHDGTCNNKRRPRWGAAQMPFNRFLPPEYGDGVDSVRSSTDGSPLSSSRFVSLLVHGARDGEAPITLMIAQWGQLLDHDMTSTAQPRSINGSIPSCCGGKDFHPSCFPIKVPLDDPWLSPLKVRCLEFLRSAPAQRRDCVLSWREQTNQATSYIDASPIYSNSAKASDNARVFRNGLLIYGRGNPADDVCQRGAIATQCIRSGDGRSGEQPGLLAMHHVWVSEHNRIAFELSELNLHWSDEKIYQETRRIVGAMFQHITFREFLPIVLGREVCKLFDLELSNSGYYEGYDPKVNPTVANAFAAAAFRFGHSLVQNSYMRCDRHHNVINNNVSLHEEFQRGDIGSAGSLHRLLRGLATQRALKRDEFITPELTNHLFQTPGFPFGLDLAAINIQRGRDHGVAPYTAWRVPCGLSAIHNWDEFSNVVGPESAKRIGHAYRSVHDIDLFVGGIAERPVVGGLVGPTFACIIAQQFSNSRKGDRFWYENGGFESSFTPAQLHSLRRVSLAQVLCRAVGGGTFQPHIFIPAEFNDNERLNCGVGPLAPIDLMPWLEQDPFAALTPRPPVFEGQVVPENVFEIMTAQNSNLHINKEDKAGFSNRVRPTQQGNNSPVTHKPNIDFIPNSSIGFQRPQNLSKINDKLDIRRKTQTTNNRITTRKPVQGVNNKLDKSPTITLNIKNVNTRRRVQNIQTTTRRTVIINNVPIELRSASATENAKETSTERTKTNTANNKSTNSTNKTKASDKAEARTIDNTEMTDEQTELPKEQSQNDTKDKMDVDKPTAAAEVTEPNNDDIDPMKQALNTLNEHKRVQRQLRIRNIKNTTSDKSLTQTTNKATTKSAEPKLIVFKQRLTYNATTTPTATTTTPTTVTTKAPKVASRTTKRSIELRSQYQSRPIYTRPQKVVVNGPNADQYEIEINIRQTNKSPLTRPNTDYTTAYKPYSPESYESSYAPHYIDYSTTTPSYGFYHSSPTIISTSAQVQRTKPPTIIYLTDSDEHRQTTTRPPNIFQNFITFATSAFNNNHNSPRPTSPSPVSAPPRDRPSYETVIINSPHSSSHTVSSAPSYESRPPTYSQVSQVSNQPHYPVATSAQIGVNPSSGYLHASSSAVSAGNFGSISGVASANGADSTFSFNIRPRPDTHQVANSYPRPIEHGGGVGSYGFLPPRKSTYSPEYVNIPISTPQSTLYYDRELTTSQSSSPFSNGQHRPQNSNFYGRSPAEVKEANDLPKVSPDHKLDINDYDYLSRTLQLQRTHTNSTDDVESVELDDYQYDDDDFDKNDSDEDNFMPPAKKFDRDGYLRPELMLGSLGKSEMANESKSNGTFLDDNYVLPMLVNKTQSYLTEMPKPIALLDSYATTTYVTDVTIFPDTLGKHLNNDISAEDSFEETTEILELSKRSALSKIGMGQPSVASSIAFAPIKVLTQPERPDNWVIFDTPSEKPLLPQTPIIKMDTQPSAEVPMPIKGFNGIWQKDQLKKKNHSKVSKFNVTAEAKAEPTTQKEAFTDDTTTMSTRQDDITTTLMPN